MNEQEYKSQLNKAKANYELKQMLHRSRQATDQELATAKKILDDLQAYQVPDPVDVAPVPETPVVTAQPVIVQPAMAVSEFTQLLEELTIEMADANKQMCERCNQLADHTDQATLQRLVREIDEYFEKRNALGEKIAFLKLHGRLPDAEPATEDERSLEATKSAFLANLPVEKFAIAQLITNSLSPKVSRARKSLRDTKDPVKKVHYEIQLAKAEAELNLAKSQLAAMA